MDNKFIIDASFGSLVVITKSGIDAFNAQNPAAYIATTISNGCFVPLMVAIQPSNPVGLTSPLYLAVGTEPNGYSNILPTKELVVAGDGSVEVYSVGDSVPCIAPNTPMYIRAVVYGTSLSLMVSVIGFYFTP